MSCAVTDSLHPTLSRPVVSWRSASPIPCHLLAHDILGHDGPTSRRLNVSKNAATTPGTSSAPHNEPSLASYPRLLYHQLPTCRPTGAHCGSPVIPQPPPTLAHFYPLPRILHSRSGQALSHAVDVEKSPTHIFDDVLGRRRRTMANVERRQPRAGHGRADSPLLGPVPAGDRTAVPRRCSRCTRTLRAE